MCKHADPLKITRVSGFNIYILHQAASDNPKERDLTLHSFSPEIANRVGLNAAVLYQNIVWWSQKNAANGKHQHDGRYWTYNSVKAFSELFPYFSPKQIRTALTRLENDGLILSGNFNNAGYDRTKWYCPVEQNDLPKKAKEIAQKGEPIPVGKPVSKPIIDKQKADAFFDAFWQSYPLCKRKTDKPKARVVFQNIVSGKHKQIPKTPPDEIISGIRNYANSMPDTEFIPLPTTWLNGERWGDTLQNLSPESQARIDRYKNIKAGAA